MGKITPLKAIRQHCLECGDGKPKSVKICNLEECPLYRYRFGKNPERKGKGGLCKKVVIQEPISERQRVG